MVFSDKLIKYEQRTAINYAKISDLTPSTSSRKKINILNNKRLVQLKENLESNKLSMKEYMLAAADIVKPNLEIELDEFLVADQDEDMDADQDEVLDVDQDEILKAEPDEILGLA